MRNLFVLLVLTVGACAPERAPDLVTRRDSAGVTIVESREAFWTLTEGWSIDPEPVLDLATTGTGPEHEFFRTWDATRLADGTIAVANQGSGEIKIFSADGAFITAVGGVGDGPGEFRRLVSVDAFRGDSLVAYDSRLTRLTVITPVYEVGRVMSPYDASERVQEMYPLSDTSFVAMIASFERTAGVLGMVRTPFPIVRLSPTGEVFDTVTVIDGLEVYEVPRVDGRALFAKTGHLAVHRGRIVTGSATDMQFEVYDEDGRLQQIARIPTYDLQLSAEEIRAERDEVLDPRMRPAVREIWESLPDPSSRPAYRDLIVDAEGYIWAGKFLGRAERDDIPAWEVFSADGDWYGDMRLPARFTALEIGTDYILGVWRDEGDAEHVQVLRLRR